MEFCMIFLFHIPKKNTSVHNPRAGLEPASHNPGRVLSLSRLESAPPHAHPERAARGGFTQPHRLFPREVPPPTLIGRRGEAMPWDWLRGGLGLTWRGRHARSERGCPPGLKEETAARPGPGGRGECRDAAGAGAVSRALGGRAAPMLHHCRDRPEPPGRPGSGQTHDPHGQGEPRAPGLGAGTPLRPASSALRPSALSPKCLESLLLVPRPLLTCPRAALWSSLPGIFSGTPGALKCPASFLLSWLFHLQYPPAPFTEPGMSLQ